MLNSSGTRISDKSLYKCSELMVSNVFVISIIKMLIELSQNVIDFHIIFSLQEYAL